MIQIEQVPIWKDGGIQKANNINAIIVNDNLETSCQFYYQLIDESQTVLIDGNISMGGEDYLAWDGSSEEAYNYIANELNIKIL